MCASHAMRTLQPVGVLLGGSGRARVRIMPSPPLAALLRPAGFMAGALARERIADAAVALARAGHLSAGSTAHGPSTRPTGPRGPSSPIGGRCALQ
jgi:hypothetical protein